MNNLFFACTDCKIYVDAGYRWAYWALEETGVVARGKLVSVSSVLSASEYWSPLRTDGADWLYAEVLPSVRRFLTEHKCHQIVYGNTSDFLAPESDGLLEWMQVGFLPLLLPRYFAERLGFKTWDEVSNFVARQDSAPWWWMLEWDGVHEKARRKFQELVESKSCDRNSIVCKPFSH